MVLHLPWVTARVGCLLGAYQCPYLTRAEYTTNLLKMKAKCSNVDSRVLSEAKFLRGVHQDHWLYARQSFTFDEYAKLYESTTKRIGLNITRQADIANATV